MTAPALNTPWRVIQDAFFNAGLIGLGDDPDSEMISIGMNRLNNLINLWQTQGLKLWLQFDLGIGAGAGAVAPLVAGTNLYKIGPTGNVIMTRPTRVLEGYYQDTNQVNRPLLVLSRNEWDTLSVFSQQGAINSYFVDKSAGVQPAGVATTNVYFWLTPDAIAAQGTAHIIVQQQQPNFISLTDTMVFPPEWFLGLGWALASELCTGQPAIIMKRCFDMSENYRIMLENFDVEDASTVFQPDQRFQYVGNSFR